MHAGLNPIVFDQVVERPEVIEHSAHERLQFVLIELLFYFVLSHFLVWKRRAGDGHSMLVDRFKRATSIPAGTRQLASGALKTGRNLSRLLSEFTQRVMPLT